jgi:asparagine synthase (glutamine-hydrolysing)
MCGICGIYHYQNGEKADAVVLRAMTAALRHRGPDDEGFYLRGSVGLGQRRLAIIDLRGGHQPLANEDQTVWITYNGEIYNFPELRQELIGSGHRFRTNTDTEVIVHAYEQFGEGSLARLNGMFAFALWDSSKQRLLLARDPLGIKPLYFWQEGERLLFASEIKAFYADPAFVAAVDPRALDQYLTFQFVPSPGTIFKGVHKLAPGHYALVECGKIQVKSFARQVPKVRRVDDEREVLAELQEAIATAVKRQMISDVPVGALLSGGVDSGTVVALMRLATGHPVKTFTVGFRGDFAQNELIQARRTAEILGTEHYEVALKAQDCLDAFTKTIWHLDEPVATPSALAMYWVSRLASDHVKVVLTGQGADEPWGGYRRYRGEKFGRWYRRLPAAVRHRVISPLVNALPRHEDFKRGVFALDQADPATRFARGYTVLSPAMKQLLYRDGLIGPEPGGDNADLLRYWQRPVAHLDSLAQQLYVETRFSLPDNLLLYGDKMAMASSLEVRVPLLDLELMGLVESLPVNLRFKGWQGHKYLYKKAIARWLSPEILDRPKLGFLTPMDDWLQSEITGYLRERLTSPGSACAQYFNRSYIDELIGLHAARRLDLTRALYCLLVFEEWHGQFMDRGSQLRLDSVDSFSGLKSTGIQVR